MDSEYVNARLDTVNREISDYKVVIADKERECIRLLHDSLNIGAETLSELNTQGERLDAISNNLRHIEATMHTAEKTVSKMEWRDKHPFLSLFIGKRGKKAIWFGGSNELAPAIEEPSSTDNPAISVRGLSSQGTRTTGGDDKFADTVQSKVSTLKNMALNMGAELDKQNAKIGDIISHTEYVTDHVDRARSRVGKLTV